MVILTYEKTTNKCIAINNDSKPLSFLLQSIALCIGSELEDFFKQNKMKYFEKSIFYFSRETIKIICHCSEEFKIDFINLTKKCYILNNVKFKHKIEFKT